MNGNVLVTGGAGFIGSSVVDALLARTPARIVVLDNLFHGKKQFLPTSDRVILEQADLRDGGAVSRVVHEYRPETVIHLAALHFIPYCNEHPAETLAVNVVGTQNVLDACTATRPETLVAASSAAVYPIHDDPCSEDRLSPGPTDIYGLSKWINEQQLELFARQAGVRCAAARFFKAIGPRETNPHLLPAILDQIKAGATELNLGNVEPKRDYIEVSDIARAVVDLAEKNTANYRAYNVGTGQEFSVREIVERLAKIVGKKLMIKTDPTRVRKSDRMHLVADLTRINREVGWQPAVSLEQGLRQLWEHERDK